MTKTPRIATALLCLGFFAAAPSASQDLAADDGPEIVRDADSVVDWIRPQPHDPDVVDTVLLFTNQGRFSGRVRCKAFDKNGAAIGRAWLAVPALGLRYALASDVAGDRDFVGHVQCFVDANVVGTAVLLAAGELSDLPVQNGFLRKDVSRRIRFPVVATY